MGFRALTSGLFLSGPFLLVLSTPAQAARFDVCISKLVELQLNRYRALAGAVKPASGEDRKPRVEEKRSQAPILARGQTFTGEGEIREVLGLSPEAPLYGPFHRLTTQGNMSPELPIASGFLAGSSLRNIYSRGEPCAKAYRGELPAGYGATDGFTFYTTAPPHD